MRNGVCTGARTHFTKTNLGGARGKSRCSLAQVKSCEKSVGTQVSFQQPLSKHLAGGNVDYSRWKHVWRQYFPLWLAGLKIYMTCFSYSLHLSIAVNWLRPTCKDVAKDAFPMRGTQLPLPPSTALRRSRVYVFLFLMSANEKMICANLFAVLMKAWNMPANIDWVVVFYCKYKLLTKLNNLLIRKSRFKYKIICFLL